ncbi:MAG TPA: alpha-amylase [Chitinophagaceae bacterium]|nr:alpha-amylase [Chitinophagaceae bacterium]
MRNGTLMQYFHWYYPGDGSLWKKLRTEAPYLARLGINAVWLPPAYKGTRGAHSDGYDVYDLYDLGEFDAKGSVRTKYGTRAEYLEAIKVLQSHQIQVYVDIVANHMGGGEETEQVKVLRMDPEDRNTAISEPYDIEAFTRFMFPARQGKYSSFQWTHACFSGVDYDHSRQETGIFNILNEHGSDWEELISDEKGNFDYLMFCDLDFRNPAVREELKRWGKWYFETTGFDGVRLDAVKHITPRFYTEWLGYMRSIAGKDLFAVGEYWAPGNLELLHRYIEATEGQIALFDAPLQCRFHTASKAGSGYDLRTIFDDTLVATVPHLAVTLVGNHDTQPLQSLEAPVEPWFLPLAYALTLLRSKGYPCVFYPDLYSAEYTDKGRDGGEHHIVLPALAHLPLLCQLRKEASYGTERDYLDHPNCIGWTREGEDELPYSGCAVVLSNGDPGNKWMQVGQRHAGRVFVDALGNEPGEILINEQGEAEFFCPGGAVSVWVDKELSDALQGNG